MRIQHNIMAMNAYRNYTNNTSMLSKNLEKLSSGYKINRAGDDAAGLAISEKMRAQITGLDVAQKNAKDGISLVQTAEGALTEVHDMLNRMVELAEQSANGTYDDVDRDQLQKEFSRLTQEIDRIADASNFNGIQLLNGKMGNPAVTTTEGALDGTTPAVAAVYKFDFSTQTALTAGQSVSIAGQTIAAASGGTIDIDSATSTSQQVTAIFNALNGGANDVSDKYTVTQDGDTITLTAKTEGVDADAAVTGANATWNSNNVAPTVTAGADEQTGVATAAKTEIDFTDKTGEDLIGGTMKIGDTTYEFVKTGEAAADGNTAIEIAENADDAAIATAVSTALTGQVTGFTAAVDGNKVTLTETAPASAAGNLTAAPEVEFDGIGITLQIGDTGADYNQITVSINSIKSTALKDMTEDTGKVLSDLNIENAGNAMEAMTSLKGMINYISDIRGDLGATQNRLDHTINNLSVMEENIQDAESTIRDTDVAEEMMAYTKNNILVQSAQAMLAQANQVPQGVLQLLQ